VISDKVEIVSTLDKSLKLVSIAFLILSILTVVFGVDFDGFKVIDRIFLGIAFLFLFISIFMFTYSAKIVITNDQYSVKHSILGFNITTRKDISGWKIIRLSARTHHSSGNTYSPRKFELDLSPHIGKEWTFDDVFISGHFQFEFDSDPIEVAEMLINLQKVTGFDVELDKSAEKLFGVTYRMMKIERRV
jgi:hypothetical protein